MAGQAIWTTLARALRTTVARALASTVLVTTVLGGAAHDATPVSAHRAALPSLAMGTEPWIGYGPWWIAKAKGFFQKEGFAPAKRLCLECRLDPTSPLG